MGNRSLSSNYFFLHNSVQEVITLNTFRILPEEWKLHFMLNFLHVLNSYFESNPWYVYIILLSCDIASSYSLFPVMTSLDSTSLIYFCWFLQYNIKVINYSLINNFYYHNNLFASSSLIIIYFLNLIIRSFWRACLELLNNFWNYPLIILKEIKIIKVSDNFKFMLKQTFSEILNYIFQKLWGRQGTHYSVMDLDVIQHPPTHLLCRMSVRLPIRTYHKERSR